MKIKHAIPSIAFALTFASVAHAATVTENFESCGTTTQSLGTDIALSAASPGPCGSIAPGITFAPDAGYDLYIAAPGQSANFDHCARC